MPIWAIISTKEWLLVWTAPLPCGMVIKRNSDEVSPTRNVTDAHIVYALLPVSPEV